MVMLIQNSCTIMLSLLVSAKLCSIVMVAKIYIGRSVGESVSHSVNSGGLCKFRTRCLNVILTRF